MLEKQAIIRFSSKKSTCYSYQTTWSNTITWKSRERQKLSPLKKLFIKSFNHMHMVFTTESGEQDMKSIRIWWLKGSTFNWLSMKILGSSMEVINSTALRGWTRWAPQWKLETRATLRHLEQENLSSLLDCCTTVYLQCTSFTCKDITHSTKWSSRKGK